MKVVNYFFLLVAVIVLMSSCSSSSKEIPSIIDTLSSANGVWVKKADLPTNFKKRAFAVSFQIQNYAYIGSGRDENGNMLSDFWKYDPVSDSWTEIASMPLGRDRAVAFALDGNGYVGTGYDESTTNNAVRTYYKDFYKYNPSSNEWQQVADFPGNPRSEAVSFTLGDKGYVALGVGTDSLYEKYNDMYSYDAANDSWTKAADFPGENRNGATAFVYNNEAYLLGGQSFSGNTPTGFYQYSPNSDSWQEVQDLKNYSYSPLVQYENIIPRMYSVSFVIDSTAFITGGMASATGGPLLNYTWAYHFKNNQWQRYPSFVGLPFVGGLAFSINPKP